MAASTKYIVTGTNHFSNGTEGIVLARDDDGNVTKEISTTKPSSLTKDELATIGSLGVNVEPISKEQAAALEAQVNSVAVGADVAGAAPVFDN